MKRKLGVNIATGVSNIVVGSIVFISFCNLIGQVMDYIDYIDYMGSDYIVELLPESTVMLYGLAWILTIVPLVLSIISIVMSKKNGISLAGPIVGCVGAIVNLLSANALGLFTGIIMVVGGIIGLIQKNVGDFEEEVAYVQAPVTREVPTTNTTNNVNEEPNTTEAKVEVGSEEEWKL